LENFISVGFRVVINDDDRWGLKLFVVFVSFEVAVFDLEVVTSTSLLSSDPKIM
jgi:hypothetical protein